MSRENNIYENTKYNHGFDGLTIVDLGANIGLECIKMEEVWPIASFILVEPDPSNCQIIRDYKDYNSKNWQVEECAVDLTSGPKEFGFHHSAGLHGRVNGSLDPFNWKTWNYEGIYPIESKTMEEICLQPDIVKMDIERHEYKILPEVCKLNPSIIFAELHGPCYPLNIEEFLESCVKDTSLAVTGWYKVYSSQDNKEDMVVPTSPRNEIGCGDENLVIIERIK